MLSMRYFFLQILFWVSVSLSLASVNHKMVCSRIDCSKEGSADNPQHRLPTNIDRRIAWIRKLREGDISLERYLTTHASKPQTSLKCCRSHFRLQDVNPLTPNRKYATLTDNALPMSPNEEKAYRKQLERDQILEQIREQATQTLGASTKVLRGGRQVVHQQSAQEWQTIIADLQTDNSSAKTELDVLRAALASKTQEAQCREEHLQTELNSALVRFHRANAAFEAERSRRLNVEANLHRAEKATEAAEREREALASSWDELRASYESKLQAAQKDAADSKRAVAELQAELQDTRAQVSQAQQSAAQLRAEVNRERTAAQVAKEEKLKADREFEEFQKSSIAQLNYDKIIADDNLTRVYTGFQSGDAFGAFLNLLFRTGSAHAYEGFYWDNNGELKKRSGPPQRLIFPQALMLTLMKLRMDFPFLHMGYLFSISQTCAEETFFRVLGILHEVLTAEPILRPLTAENFRDGGFKCFKERGLQDVCIVIDATELFMQTPGDPELQKLTWSVYKHHNTLKALIGMRQDGTICFVSDCYGGKISDKQITESSKLTSCLPKNSVVMADKGFNVHEHLAEAGMKLLLPPMCVGGGQFTPEQLQFTRVVAAVRIHVERAICKAKQYRMLVHEVPVNMAAHYSKICRTVFFLTNLTGVLVHESDD